MATAAITVLTFLLVFIFALTTALVLFAQDSQLVEHYLSHAFKIGTFIACGLIAVLLFYSGVSLEYLNLLIKLISGGK